MKILILFNKIDAMSPVYDQETFEQVEIVYHSLEKLGHTVSYLGVDLDLDTMLRRVEISKPDLIFNLVEGLECQDSLIYIVPAVLDSAGYRYTGNSSETLFLTSNKVIAKSFFNQYDIPTPLIDPPNPPYIIKHKWNHGSTGITTNSIIHDETIPLVDEDCFIEQYIAGKEFTVSLVQNKNTVEILPIRTYSFISTSILDYDTKWVDGSSVIPTCDLCYEDAEIGKVLEDISLKCWDIFEMSGYARMDFRVDKNNCPYLLEVNANPSLSKNGALYNSAVYAGLNIDQIIDKIVSI